MVVRLLNDEEDRREIVRASLEKSFGGFGNVWFSFCNVYMYIFFFKKERERIDCLDINILNCVM